MTPEEKVAKLKKIKELRALLARRDSIAQAQPPPPTPGLGEHYDAAIAEAEAQHAKGREQFSRNPLAGGMNIALAAGKGLIAPVTAGFAATRQMPVIGDIQQALEVPIGAVGSGAGWLAERAVEGIGRGAFVPPFLAREVAEPVGEIANIAAQGAVVGGVVKGVKAAPGAVRSAAENVKVKSAERVGGALLAGKSVEKMRRSGQYIADKNIPIARPRKGAEKAKADIKSLAEALNEKIIDPATEAGIVIEGGALLRPLREYQAQLLNAAPPASTEAAAVGKLIIETERRLQRSQTPGSLTPREAQDLKVLNNQILGSFYPKFEGAGATVSPLESAKKAGRKKFNDALRGGIETVDPQIRAINQTEGAGIEVSQALDRFVEARLKRDPSVLHGPGITGAAAGNPRVGALYAFGELYGSRPMRAAFNKRVNQAASFLTGKPSEFVRASDVRPFSGAPPASTAAGGGAPPWMPPPPPPPTRQLGPYQPGPVGTATTTEPVSGQSVGGASTPAGYLMEPTRELKARPPWVKSSEAASQPGIAGMPPELSDMMKTYAKSLLGEAQGAFHDTKAPYAQRGNIGNGWEVTGFQGALNLTNYPEWIRDLGFTKKEAIATLEKILDGTAKGKRAQRLIETMQSHLLEGREASFGNFGPEGFIPPDANFSGAYGAWKAGRLGGPSPVDYPGDPIPPYIPDYPRGRR